MGVKKDKAIAAIKRAFPDSTLPIGTRLIVMGSESDAPTTAKDFIKVARAVMALRKSNKPEISRGFANRTGPLSVAEEAETTQILSQGGPRRSIALLQREGDSEIELARPRAVLEETLKLTKRRSQIGRSQSPSQRDFDRA